MARAVRHGGRVDTALLITCVLLAFVARVLPANLRDPLAAGLRRSVVAPFIAMHTQAELARNAWRSYEQRSVARDSLVLQANESRALRAENDRLRRVLGLGSQLRWGFVPAEALHDRGRNEEFTLALTAGVTAGVEAFSPVVAPEGLVGMVHQVDPSMSLAILWAHPDFRVSAMAEDGTAFGIVAAHLGDEGPERYMLEMRGVPFRSHLDTGTAIVSSGLGGVYPRGIPIGTVVAELQTPEGWARTYLLRPAVRPHDVTSVMILSPQRVAAGIEGVWTKTNADANVRTIVRAADSLARTAVAEEAAARRAVLDSARRDSVAAAAAAAPPRRDTTPVRAVAPTRRDTAAARQAVPTPRRDTARSEPRADTTVRPAPQRDTTPAAPRPDTSRRSDTTARPAAPDTVVPQTP